MKVSRKKHILILLAIGLVYFVGIAAIVYPIVGNMVSLDSSKAVIHSYVNKVESLTDSEIEEKFRNAEGYNESLRKGSYDESREHALDLDDGLMCYVEIPSLSIYLPVYYGTASDTLLKGCGWLPKTSLPVGGESTHASISGHTGLPNAEMFTKLDNIHLEDVFYIHVLNRTLTYKVDKIETVNPNDTKHLLVVPGEDHLTLLTCTPYGINDKRLLVRGVRVGTVDHAAGDAAETDRNSIYDAAARADEGLQKQINHSMTVITVIVIVAVCVCAAACIWLGRVVKRRSFAPKYARKKGSEEHSDKEEEKE